MSSASHLAQKSKRRNAPLSCAECRRLKLRCSRVFPCASCVKKGCAAICPDGSLTTGKGNRFVLANTEVLHDKITILSNRVRALEDALQVHDPHNSLLTEELRALKRPLERESPEEQAQEQEQESVESINVGSLSITESGHTKFFGGMANAWYLLQNEAGSDDEEASPQMHIPRDLPWISYTFPFSTTVNESPGDARARVLDALPDHAKARRLANIYFKHAAWMYSPLPEAEFEETIFSRVYEQQMETEPSPMDAHRLAVLCFVLGLGALLDLDSRPLSSEAAHYYQLGRAALSLVSILESQSIPAIQALILMCHYMFLSFVEGPRWALMGLAVKLAQSLGLHRDSGRWNLDGKETFRRRSLFYELYTYDSWQSLTYGRPPSFAPAFIDCKMPEEPIKNDQGELEMSFAAWKHRFSFKCLGVVHERAFGATVPRYSVIVELDKKVRDFYVPPSLRVPGFGGSSMEAPHVQPPIELTMQRYIAFAIKEMTLFYLHRGFFARALEESPGDPLGSKYAPSVLAAYNCACTFVGLIRSLYSQHPGLTVRMWFLFTHVFSCSIVLGSIATKCPTMALAPSALSNLDSALSLFNEVSDNARAAKVLPVLRKLKARAVAAKQAVSNTSPNPNVSQSPTDVLVKEEDEELAALGGKTRLVSRKTPPHSSPSSPQGSSQQSASPVEQGDRDAYMQPDSPPVASPESPVPAPAADGAQWGGSAFMPPVEVYDYGYQEMAAWQPSTHSGHAHSHSHSHGHAHGQAHAHAQAHMSMQGIAMDMQYVPMQYNGYEPTTAHAHGNGHASIAMHSQYMQPHSPMDTHHIPQTDPMSSWGHLFNEYNQA
ncbi:fungal-specific transcription factor domain-containing protein [Trametes meyenii]|nr:fungal-specific transcription factor domain-containing protein [Trametes meyenii]